MHCSTAQCKISSPLFSAALQIRLTACLCHCKYTYGDLLFIQLYSDNTNALQHWSGQNSFQSVKTGSQHACAFAITPMEICCSYRCAVMQHQCTVHCSTAQQIHLCKTSSPLFSAALQIRLTACLCHCKYTYGDLLFIQLYSDATPMHCSTGQGRTASNLSTVALQNRLTACLCLCNHTYGDLLFIQVCSEATSMHCSCGQGKTSSPLFSADLQIRLRACLCHCKHSY